MVVLQCPSLEILPQFVAALEGGWSPNNIRPEARLEQLEHIRKDPAEFIASLDDKEARGAPVKMKDVSTVPRLPGFNRWIWDGAFSGLVSFRWQKGSNALPDHCLGHIGFNIVPEKRRRGYATKALALLLPEARAQGLGYVELTTDLDNIGSQKVITANGGQLHETFIATTSNSGAEMPRYRIKL